MADCQKCIFPRLRGCPVMGSKNCDACLNLYKDYTTCRAQECPTCRLLKYCKEKKINLNRDKSVKLHCKNCRKELEPNRYKKIELIDTTHHSITQKLGIAIELCFDCFLKLTEEESNNKENKEN